MYEDLRVPGLIVENTTGMIIPIGPSAGRATAPKEGTFRANTSLGGVEIFINGSWVFYSGRQLIVQNTINADTALTAQSRYPVNTSNNLVQVTLPRDPKPGDEVSMFDYGHTWDRNPLRVLPSAGDKVDGATLPKSYYDQGGAVTYMYIDSQRGWITVNRAASSEVKGIDRWVHINTQGDYTLEPGIGYSVDTAAIGAPIELKLPATVELGKEIVVADVTGRSGQFPITLVTAKRIGGVVGNYSLRADWGMLSLIALTDNNWQVITDSTISRSQTAHVYAPITTTNFQAVSGNWYPVDLRAGALAVIMPVSPTVGDVVRFYDKYGKADANALTIRQAASGEPIRGKAVPLVVQENFASLEFIYSGPGTDEGWQLTNSANYGLQSSVTAYAAGTATINPDFTGDARTATILVNRNLAITGAAVNQKGVTSFFIILEVDSVGGYNVTLPGMADGWHPALGSAPVRADANTTNVIQGIYISGRVYYTNTIHKRA